MNKTENEPIKTFPGIVTFYKVTMDMVTDIYMHSTSEQLCQTSRGVPVLDWFRLSRDRWQTVGAPAIERPSF